MALKLLTQIKRWIDETPPAAPITNQKTLPNGLYYDFTHEGRRFCLVLQDLKAGLRANWIFHRSFTYDERHYWEGRYEFRICDDESDGRLTKSILQIKDVENNNEVKVVMSRMIPTLRVFKKDLRWILVMMKQGGAT